MTTKTIFLAVAQWGFPADLGTLPAHHKSAEFDTLPAAQEWAVQQGGHDSDGLLKVYEGYYDEDDQFIEIRDYYFNYDDNGEWEE